MSCCVHSSAAMQNQTLTKLPLKTRNRPQTGRLWVCGVVIWVFLVAMLLLSPSQVGVQPNGETMMPLVYHLPAETDLTVPPTVIRTPAVPRAQVPLVLAL